MTKEIWTAKDGFVISNMPTGHDDSLNIRHYGGHLVCESVRWEKTGNIIAASLDLLEAAEELDEALNCVDELTPEQSAAREKLCAAIRKARGEK